MRIRRILGDPRIEYPFNVWRMYVAPSGDKCSCNRGIIMNRTLTLALADEVIGFGWQITKKPVTKDDYLNAIQVEYSDDHGIPHNAKKFLKEMQPGDLIWFKNQLGSYFLAAITSDWMYIEDPLYKEADMVNVRRIIYCHYGRNVPDLLKRFFRGRHVIEKIDNLRIKLFSASVFNALCERKYLKFCCKETGKDGNNCIPFPCYPTRGYVEDGSHTALSPCDAFSEDELKQPEIEEVCEKVRQGFEKGKLCSLDMGVFTRIGRMQEEVTRL